MDPYVENGYKNRKEYLKELSQEYGEVAIMLAEVLGPEEDFDGLVSHLEDPFFC